MKCTFCKTTKGVDRHHVDKNHGNETPENVIPLCKSCHVLLHRRVYRPLENAGMLPPPTKRKEAERPRIPFQKTANEVLAFIYGFYDDNKTMPTRREIAEHFSRVRDRTYSDEWARWVLAHLERSGRVRIEPGKHRGIELVIGGSK